MTSVIEKIRVALERESDDEVINDALLNAAFLFEKARGLSACAWPDEVVECSLSVEDLSALRRAVVAYVERMGVGSWSLGKCCDPTLKPVFIEVVRRQLNGDAGELFQAMIALSNIGEPIFGGVCSRSILDEHTNRELARVYLSRQ
jgi:hypothetical protein